GQKHKLVSLAQARDNRTKIEWRADDVPAPEFVGVRVLDDFPLATLREYIDWTPFFHTWEPKGVYPRILQHEKYGEQARQIFAEGNALLDRMVRERSIRVRGVYGFFPANAVVDDVELYDAGPAAMYADCPDHTEKGTLWQLLDAERATGIKLTESFAMWPGSSVSGLYFAHPASRYFTVGKIGRDQVVDYAARKGMTIEEVER